MDIRQLALQGFSRPDEVFIRTMLELAVGIDIAQWQLADHDSADVLLLNADTSRLDSTSRSGNAAIVVRCSSAGTEQAGSLPPDTTLMDFQLPLTYAKLVALLGQLQVHLANKAIPRPLPTRRFYEDMRLLGLLKSVLERKRPVEIIHPRFTPLRIFPAQQTFAIPVGGSLLPDMFRILPAKFLVHELNKAEDKQPPPNWPAKPLWKLLFLAALYGSEGRLPEHAEADDRLSLTAEPDYSVVPQALSYREIAGSLQVLGTADVATLAEHCGRSLEDVIDFCNACEEMLLLTREPQETNENRYKPAQFSQ